MAKRILYGLVAIACLWGGSYLVQADFTPMWMTFPISLTAFFVGFPCFMGMLTGKPLP